MKQYKIDFLLYQVGRLLKCLLLPGAGEEVEEKKKRRKRLRQYIMAYINSDIIISFQASWNDSVG